MSKQPSQPVLIYDAIDGDHQFASLDVVGSWSTIARNVRWFWLVSAKRCQAAHSFYGCIFILRLHP